MTILICSLNSSANNLQRNLSQKPIFLKFCQIYKLPIIRWKMSTVNKKSKKSQFKYRKINVKNVKKSKTKKRKGRRVSTQQFNRFKLWPKLKCLIIRLKFINRWRTFISLRAICKNAFYQICVILCGGWLFLSRSLLDSVWY